MAFQIKEIVIEPSAIGLTRTTKKKVWLNPKVSIKYKKGNTVITSFEAYPEAMDFVAESLTKDRDVAK